MAVHLRPFPDLKIIFYGNWKTGSKNPADLTRNSFNIFRQLFFSKRILKNWWDPVFLTCKAGRPILKGDLSSANLYPNMTSLKPAQVFEKVIKVVLKSRGQEPDPKTVYIVLAAG